MPNDKAFAFVLMPFDRNFDDIYRYGIKQTAELHQVIAQRVDEQHFTESILEQIYSQIENSDFVIAEMTGKNANVFYEVGYAHAKGKLCALVTQNAADIPFDLKHYPHVIYDGTATDLQEKLGPKIEWLKEEARRLSGRIISVTAKAGPAYLKQSEYSDTGSFDLDVTLRNQTNFSSPEILACYIVTSKHWNLRSDGKSCEHDQYSGEGGRAYRKHQINLSVRRLAPNAFYKFKVEFQKTFWTLFSGKNRDKVYHAKGSLTLIIETEDKQIKYDMDLDVLFEEFPF